MNGAERYLTRKARPGKAVIWLENAALVALFLVIAALVQTAVYGYMTYGLMAAHAALAAIILAIFAVMNLLTERKRCRMHAERIVRALLQQEDGCILCDEMGKHTGVRKAADEAVRLGEKGYLTDVVLRKGCIGLADRMPEAVEEVPVTPIFKN